jgi:homoserine O-acetyltransferase
MRVIADRAALRPIHGDVDLGAVALESGATLRRASLRFEMVGNPDAPVILVCHALTGNHETVGYAGDGWWSGLVGAGLPIDTERYQVITFNILGGCSGSTGPASTNPDTGKPYQTDFPFVTVRDIAKVQLIALNRLGIRQVEAVIGGSLGGMLALELGISAPDRFNKVICLAATPYVTDYAMAFNAIGRKAIMDDPAWRGGRYDPERPPSAGLETARMVGMVTYRSQALFNRRFQRERKDGWGNSHDETAFQIESYLRYQGKKLARRFDPNSYLYLLKAMDSHDIGRGRGGWRRAIKELKAPLLGIGFRGDLLYPPEMIRQMVEVHRTVQPASAFFEVETEYGHDGFLTEFEKWGGRIREWLNGD